jgi:hypothetical protein
MALSELSASLSIPSTASSETSQWPAQLTRVVKRIFLRKHPFRGVRHLIPHLMAVVIIDHFQSVGALPRFVRGAMFVVRLHPQSAAATTMMSSPSILVHKATAR